MFNYNLINPINITYRNPKQDPSYKKEDGKEGGQGNLLAPVNPDEKGQRQFPNGNKVQIDYTKNKVNIAQVIEDFKSTIAAINAPEEIAGEVNSYLGLVERESKKENPSREIVLSNLRNASKISDRFIEDSLKKPSTVVEDWVNALFLQHVDLKSDPSFVNEAFRVQIPENKRQNLGVTGAAAGVDTFEHSASTVSASSGASSEIAGRVNGFNAFDAGLNSTPLLDAGLNAVSDADLEAAPSAFETQGASLNTVSSSNDFGASSVNIYDIPQNKVTLNEIKPIGSAGNGYYIEDATGSVSTFGAQAEISSASVSFKGEKADINKDLTYSTTAPDLGNAHLHGAVSFEEVQNVENEADTGVYKIGSTEGSSKGTNRALRTNSASNQKQVPSLSYNEANFGNSEGLALPPKAMSLEERAARSNFVRAKRIVKENGDPYNALKLYDEALKLVQNSDDENLKADIHFELGKFFDDYDYAEYALKDYNSATKCSDYNLKTHAHIKMGRIYDDYVMFDPAVQQYSLAVETSEEAQNPAGKTKALKYLAALFADRYDKENTEIFNALSVDAARETGNLKTLSKTLMDAAENFEYVGEDTKALKTYKEAAKVLYETGDFDTLSKNYEAASEIMERLGNGAKAMSLLSKALLYRQKAELQAA